jgi:hypothetical protein
MPRKTYLFSEPHVPTKAAFPVIDAHNHLWGKWDVDNMVKVMDEVGVVSYCDLTANARIAWAGGGYQIQPGDFQEFITNCVHRFPGRF